MILNKGVTENLTLLGILSCRKSFHLTVLSQRHPVLLKRVQHKEEVGICICKYSYIYIYIYIYIVDGRK